MIGAALYNASVDLLNAAVAALDAHSSLGAPERRYVSVGDPALDCDQVTVAAAARVAAAPVTGRGTDTYTQQSRPRVIAADFRVLVVRCGYPSVAADGSAPPDTEIEAASAALYEDGWALFIGLSDGARSGTITLSGAAAGWEVASLEPVGAEGAVAGWLVRCSATLRSV